MISKIAPLMVMGMAAQSYYNKTKKGKQQRKEAMKKKMYGKKSSVSTKDLSKAMAKKKLGKSKKCSKCSKPNCGCK